MGQLSHREDVPFPLFDADNHLYEPPEALTKFLPKEYKDFVQYVQINGRTKIAIRGQISNYIPNPTFEVVARPGAWEEYFKFGNPDGKTKRELFGEPMRAIPAFFEPGPRLEKMNELGLDRTLMFPTLASLLEERLRDDPVAIHVLIHALNEWLDEVWGFNYQNRIFTTPVITLPIVEKAIEELEWAVKRGARCILVRPAPVPGFRGPRSFALPEFDPFWERVVEYDLLVGMHSSDSGYSRYTSEWDAGPGGDQLLRCRFLIERALATPGYRGVMCYSLPEALWLHAAGTSDDLLVAYPTVDRGALRALAADEPGPAARHDHDRLARRTWTWWTARWATATRRSGSAWT